MFSFREAVTREHTQVPEFAQISIGIQKARENDLRRIVPLPWPLFPWRTLLEHLAQRIGDLYTSLRFPHTKNLKMLAAALETILTHN